MLSPLRDGKSSKRLQRFRDARLRNLNDDRIHVVAGRRKHDHSRHTVYRWVEESNQSQQSD